MHVPPPPGSYPPPPPPPPGSYPPVPPPPGTATAATAASTVSAEQLAEIFDCTPRRIQQLANQGVVVKVARGQYDQNESTTNYIQFWRNIADGKGYDDDQKGTSKAQLEKARARKATVEANKAEESVYNADDVQIVLNETMVLIATQMDGLSGRLCNDVAAMNNSAEIRILLLNEMRAIRENAANKLASLATASASRNDIETTTEQDSGPMGLPE
jgi:phage terminase Nu1 subunit (DNA packaging protein)